MVIPATLYLSPHLGSKYRPAQIRVPGSTHGLDPPPSTVAYGSPATAIQRIGSGSLKLSSPVHEVVYYLLCLWEVVGQLASRRLSYITNHYSTRNLLKKLSTTNCN